MDSSRPQSPHDWTIHSINIHGIFFEKACRLIVSESSGWTLRSVNYPVEYPPARGPLRGNESKLDIRAESRDGNRLLTLLIECKKNNPKLVDWIFFPKPFASQRRPIVVHQLRNMAPNPPGWQSVGGLVSMVGDYEICDEAREAAGKYEEISKKNENERTKTANKAITEAADQIALATQAIVKEERRFSNLMGSDTRSLAMPWAVQLVIPAIVTTARLFSCEFDPNEVNTTTGEIPYDKVQLIPRDLVIFEHALPPRLQHRPARLVDAILDNSLEEFMRLHILVMHSGYSIQHSQGALAAWLHFSKLVLACRRTSEAASGYR